MEGERERGREGGREGGREEGREGKDKLSSPFQAPGCVHSCSKQRTVAG